MVRSQFATALRSKRTDVPAAERRDCASDFASQQAVLHWQTARLMDKYPSAQCQRRPRRKIAAAQRARWAKVKAKAA